MKIDYNTKFITLIGDPLAQSFAARMQNAGYEAAGMNLRYFYTETGSEHLSEIVKGIKFMPSFAGFAVTKPNKVEVVRYLDRLDPFCEKMGACNTVVRDKDGTLTGYNTDGVGFLRSIQEHGIKVEDNTFFCFGAGGAGRAISSILAYSGAGKIYITDIFEESTKSLVNDINTNFAEVAEAVPYGSYDVLSECTVVMNASGIGMGKTIGETPLPPEHIRKEQFYFDACYNPDRTQFLINAHEKGCRVLNGLQMSLYQGVAQVELWTGKKAPVEAMRKELLEILGENR
ncbi:shikimate 5-dehydrogenase [Lachnospiraceae bacterium JC7]|nr:shikimate 5-dehydrogenase [Lachnospiraceae bacterium JC7]